MRIYNKFDAYDVAVCGGGPSGIMAAVAAARNGFKTLLIERYGFLGGMATASMVSPLTTFSKGGQRIIGGLPMEFCKEMERLGGADTGWPSGRIPFDPEVFKLAAQRMVVRADVALLLHSHIGGCAVDKAEPGRIESVIVHNKSGEAQIKAGVFIDCTGDADVAHAAGFPCKKAARNEMQPMTLWFRLGDVDTDRLENMEMRLEGIRSVNTRIRSALLEMGAGRSGAHIPLFGGPWLLTALRPGMVTVNMTRYAGDGADVLSLTEAECTLREDVFRFAALLRENFAEFKDSYVIDTGVQAGVRETRRIDGLYEMTADDILSPKNFNDTIAQGGHPMDIHKAGSAEQDLIKTDDCAKIPYRALVPKGSVNLLVAGRCVSATSEALASIRVMATCMAMGQAAGTAAALCVQKHVPVPELEGAYLRGLLREQGAIV